MSRRDTTRLRSTAAIALMRCMLLRCTLLRCTLLRCTLLLGVASALVTLAPGLSPGAAHADEPVVETEKKEKPSVDSADVYLGNASHFRSPAEVDANAVYAEISEYKKILEDEVEPGSARYELLMNKASRRFKSALRKVARAGGYDLVARVGSVKNAGAVPDVTQDVIDQL